MPTQPATASLSGSGQHYALELEIPIGTDAKDVTLSWALPAAAYVDRDEVETRGSWPTCVRTVQFTGASDVEAPEFDAAVRVVQRPPLATPELSAHYRAGVKAEVTESARARSYYTS